MRLAPRTTAPAATLEPRFQPEFGVYWAQLNMHPFPSFNPEVLIEVRRFIDGITASQGKMAQDGRIYDINYAVLSSKIPGVFSLCGDLALFRNAIIHQDRCQLLRYGHLCIGNCSTGESSM